MTSIYSPLNGRENREAAVTAKTTDNVGVHARGKRLIEDARAEGKILRDIYRSACGVDPVKLMRDSINDMSKHYFKGALTVEPDDGGDRIFVNHKGWTDHRTRKYKIVPEYVTGPTEDLVFKVFDVDTENPEGSINLSDLEKGQKSLRPAAYQLAKESKMPGGFFRYCFDVKDSGEGRGVLATWGATAAAVAVGLGLLFGGAASFTEAKAAVENELLRYISNTRGGEHLIGQGLPNHDIFTTRDLATAHAPTHGFSSESVQSVQIPDNGAGVSAYSTQIGDKTLSLMPGQSAPIYADSTGHVTLDRIVEGAKEAGNSALLYAGAITTAVSAIAGSIVGKLTGRHAIKKRRGSRLEEESRLLTKLRTGEAAIKDAMEAVTP